MNFAVHQRDQHPFRDDAALQVINAFLKHGHSLQSNGSDVNFVLNLTDTRHPSSTRRKSQSVFVISFLALDSVSEDFRSLLYTLLVRTLSNLLVAVTPSEEMDTGVTVPEKVYFMTPEGGFYCAPFSADVVYERMLPVVGSHYAIGNRISQDLPERLWGPSPIVDQIARFGREMDALGVLPAPFPLHEYLSEADLRHVYRLYGMTGLSYGNLSARDRVPELGESTFWMTGRGVNKAQLSRVGKDILLVTGFDPASCEVWVSVPPGTDAKARVSMDAVEHEFIYRTFPTVGAIVHVHAWIEGVLSATQNYPCGTIELAEEVTQMLSKTGQPEAAAVGLKNHGLTITGPSLEEIFDRVRSKLLRQVPMIS